MNQKSVDSPLVSLVIPVYNSMPYLVETLDAIESQGLDESQLEVVLVNDGSNDGSETVLAEYAALHPNYRLINQPNSGGPADPCNKGIAMVTGKYFFVVGSDDVLTDGALGELAAYAEKHGSDIVLAKMAGLNGRHAPGSMFKVTKVEAHLVKDKLFNSLTAIKLFRTDLVRKTGAYNPTHLKVGSDQPFTAACYLAASTISVCADRPYVLIRRREDGGNVTSSHRSSSDYSDLLTAVVEVIIEWTEPGALRDGVLHRPVFGAMRRSLQPRFLEVGEEEQERIVSEMQRVMGPHFNDAVAAHLDSVDRLKARLALAGRTDDLRSLITWEKRGSRQVLVHDGDGFRLDLPPELASQIDAEMARDVKVVGVAKLVDLDVTNGRLLLDASAQVRNAAAAADDVVVRLRRRDTGESIDHPVLEQEPLGGDGSPGVRFHAEIDSDRLDRGVWDLLVVQRFGDDEVENRLGRTRSERVTGERYVLADEGRHHRDRGVAYFTKGFGNISLDIGYTLIPRSSPETEITGVLALGSGNRIALLRTVPGESPTLTLLRAEGSGAAGEQASTVYLDHGLIAVQVPGGFDRIKVADPQGAIVLPLPASVGFTKDGARARQLGSTGSGTSAGLATSETKTASTSTTTSARPAVIAEGLRKGRGIARRMGMRRPSFFTRR